MAEVLITLTIIGVIAAMTIPNLLQKHQEQEMVSRLKKSYSVLSNAFTQAIRENGPVDEWDIGPKETAVGAEKLYNYIKPYLKVQKYCGKEKGCFASEYKTMTGNIPSVLLADNNTTAFSKFTLQDGTSVLLWIKNADCNEDSYCAAIETDINGKKGPNKFGIDYFHFELYREKLLSFGEKKYCVYKGTDTYNGFSCAKWVITKGNMDYLRRDVSNEW